MTTPSAPSCGFLPPPESPPTSRSESALRRKIETLLGADLRSLALFRISLAMVVIADLLNRAVYLRAHYTDWGVLPRAALIEHASNRWYLSLHLMNGTAWVQAALFGLSGVAALFLLAGYRTRVFTVVSWFLLISLHARNPIVLQAGDVLLRLLLFWSMFLPLGAAYSVDRALASSTASVPKRVFSGGTVGILLQLCFVYWFTVSLKSPRYWLTDATAVYYALNIDQFTTSLGYWLLQFPAVLAGLTLLTIAVELFGPIIAFSPWRTGLIRTGVVMGMISLHLAFGLGLELGLFPVISALSWLVFLPSAFWDWLGQRLRVSQKSRFIIYYDGDCGFCKKSVFLLKTVLILPEVSLVPAQQDPERYRQLQEKNSWIVVGTDGTCYSEFAAFLYLLRQSPIGWPFSKVLSPFARLGTRLYQVIAHNRLVASRLVTAHLDYRPVWWRLSPLGNGLAAFFLLYSLLWNLTTLPQLQFALPPSVAALGRLLRLDQKWNMFAPYPLKDDGWYVIPGQLRTGADVDLFSGGAPVSWEKPQRVAQMYPNQRWRKYMMNLWKKDYRHHRLYYGRYLCREWNSTHGAAAQLSTLQIYFMKETTQLDTPSAPQKTLLWSHECFKKTTD